MNSLKGAAVALMLLALGVGLEARPHHRHLLDGSDSEEIVSSDAAAASEASSSDEIEPETRKSSTRVVEMPKSVAADSTYELYEYRAGEVCSGAPMKTVDMMGEGTDTACRTECDSLFGCKAFSVETEICMLFSDCELTEVNDIYVSGVLNE